MSARTIRLHGGPRHGVQMIIDTERTPGAVVIHQPLHDAGDPEAPVTLRHGQYTPVAGSSVDYEWDGWKS